MNGLRIVVFAKAPLPGQAKTRLIPALGPAAAAALALRMLHETLAQALAAGCASVELCASPAPGSAAWAGVDIAPAVCWTEQGEGDLGARMARAAQRVLAGGDAVLLIGTDCPALDAARLKLAAAALCSTDAVMAPSADGGYALLGLRRFHPSVFDDIIWSTPTVAAMTRARLAALGWNTQLLAEVHDIDEAADLCWLPATWGDFSARGTTALGLDEDEEANEQ